MIIRQHLFYRRYLKRFLGLILSILSLLLLCPFMIMIGVLIKADSQGKIIFKQKRLGKNQKLFTIYKFRTMYPINYPQIPIKTYNGDSRITRFGCILRRTSLDELPQLFNIIKGEMCIVGPRPILEEEFKPYQNIALYKRRFEATPGLFCTVDVDYRARATREMQFEMDREYTFNISFILDAKIFIKIIKTILKRENIYPNSLNETSNLEENSYLKENNNLEENSYVEQNSNLEENNNLEENPEEKTKDY